jgi:hypothetical protein
VNRRTALRLAALLAAAILPARAAEVLKPQITPEGKKLVDETVWEVLGSSEAERNMN